MSRGEPNHDRRRTLNHFGLALFCIYQFCHVYISFRSSVYISFSWTLDANPVVKQDDSAFSGENQTTIEDGTNFMKLVPGMARTWQMSHPRP